ncbi:hypothetical protein GCM10010840_18730 [Deinococcus aerolatus]|uniref:Uncharacterized protein n=1 Tax=Deinococcus aerolatus TaxID=522487 RepID=A0ABQ2G8P8_9DEIO|nr:hypothetical protein GCM10010840_18730 [Deinococcus aerolatus]
MEKRRAARAESVRRQIAAHAVLCLAGKEEVTQFIKEGIRLWRDRCLSCGFAVLYARYPRMVLPVSAVCALVRDLKGTVPIMGSECLLTSPNWSKMWTARGRRPSVGWTAC